MKIKMRLLSIMLSLAVAMGMLFVPATVSFAATNSNEAGVTNTSEASNDAEMANDAGESAYNMTEEPVNNDPAVKENDSEDSENADADKGIQAEKTGGQDSETGNAGGAKSTKAKGKTISNKKAGNDADENDKNDIKSAKIIFLNGVSGIDTNDGTTEEKAVKTFARAKELYLQADSPEGICITRTVTVGENEHWELPAPKGSEENHGVIFRGSNCSSYMVNVNNKGKLELSNIILDGKKISASAVLAVKENSAATIGENATIRNGNASNGGGVYAYNGQVTIDGGNILNNKASNSGGGVYLDNYTNLVINEGRIAENYAGSEGGGVSAPDKSTVIEMNGGEVENNKSAAQGGGVYIGGMYSDTEFKMNGGVFRGNKAGRAGGGLFVQVNSIAEINAGTFTENTAFDTNASYYGYYGGGAIYVNGGYTEPPHNCKDGILNLGSVEITDNYSREEGGGIGACPTSTVNVEVNNGGVIYDNFSVGFLSISNIPSDVFAATGSAGFNGVVDHYGEGVHMLLSEYMLDGSPNRWKHKKTGEYLTGSEIRSIEEVHLINDVKTDDPGVVASAKRAKVHIVGNQTRSGKGGGIATNGRLTIGKVVDHKVNIKFEKKWNDEGFEKNRPTAIRVWLLRDGERVISEIIKPGENGNWKGEFKDQPKYVLDEGGNETNVEYNYSVEEDMDYVIGTAAGENDGDPAEDITMKDKYRSRVSELKSDDPEVRSFTIENKLKEDVGPVSVRLEALKRLDGKAPGDKVFNFGLYDMEGELLQTAENKADGKIEFDSIEFEKTGEYTFKIKEIAGEDSSIKYDSNEYMASVVVVDDGYELKIESVTYKLITTKENEADKDEAGKEEADKEGDKEEADNYGTVVKETVFKNETIPEEPEKPEEPPTPDVPAETEDGDKPFRPNNPPEKTDKPVKPDKPEKKIKVSKEKTNTVLRKGPATGDTGTGLAGGIFGAAMLVLISLMAIRRRRE